jgi:hypothetical protein
MSIRVDCSAHLATGRNPETQVLIEKYLSYLGLVDRAWYRIIVKERDLRFTQVLRWQMLNASLRKRMSWRQQRNSGQWTSDSFSYVIFEI